MDGNEGTTEGTVEAQPQENAPATGTPQTPDEVTTLRSRNAGLDAKVTALQREAAEAKRIADEAARKLADYESGTVEASEALRAQIAAKDAELAAVRKEATLAKVAAAYPETFNVLGDAVQYMSADQLAEAEARFKGVPAESTVPPVPVGNSVSRAPAAATKSIEEMSLAELKEYAPRAFAGLTWEALSQSD